MKQRVKQRAQLVATISIALAASAWSATPTVSAPPRDRAMASAVREAQRLLQAGNFTKGDSMAAAVLQLAGQAQPPDSTSMAKALYLRANLMMVQAKFQDPRLAAFATQGLALLRGMAHPDTVDWIATEWFAGKLLTELDRPDSALIHLAAARRLCRPGVPKADSLLAEVWITTGRTYRRAGQPDSSLHCFEAARRLFAKTHGPEHPTVATALAELGASQTALDRFDAAQANLTAALLVLERAHGPDALALATPLAQLANVQYLSGDIAGSIETLDRAVAIRTRIEGVDSPRTIPLRHAIALRLFDFGDYAGARSRLEALLPPTEAAFGPGNTRTESVRMLAGAAAFLMDDTTAAARYLVPAYLALTRGPLDAQHLGTYVSRWHASLLLRRGDLEGAERSIAAGLARERASDRTATPALMNLLEGALEIRMTRADSAGVDSTLAAMLALFPDRSQEGSIPYAAILRLRARGEAWRGRRRPAWDLALEAERLERARLLWNVRALDDRRALELAGGLAEPLDQLISLARVDDPASMEVAWDRVVRWRGLVAAEVAGRRAPRQASADTALLAAHRRWIDARHEHARLEVSSARAGDTAGALLSASRERADEAERRYVALCARRGVARDTSRVDLARVRRALDTDQALISLVEVAPRTERARTFAFATTGPRGELHMVDLGPSSPLAAAVAQWRQALGMPPDGLDGRQHQPEAEAACRLLGGRVAALTWQRLVSVLGEARRVTIVADGDLAELPWHALPVEPDRYLVEAGPELQLLGAERELLWHRQLDGRGMLALGGPDFDLRQRTEGDPGAATVVAMRGPLADCAAPSLAFQPLPGARAEVAEVARTWERVRPDAEAKVRVGAEATERAFKAEAPGCELVHIATHGIVWSDACVPLRSGLRGVGGVAPLDRTTVMAAHESAAIALAGPSAPSAPPLEPKSPLTSPWAGRQVWLALAGANRVAEAGGDADEGLLTADEVVTLDLSGVDWVVLSACQSAAGEQWPREGSIGMQRAFRLAGARTVIASQWPIADEATREWMRALYAARAAGRLAACEATREASRTVLAARRADGRGTHPFYWAAFTGTGP